MTFSMLDTVVLQEDLPTSGLKAGDIDAIVEVHSDEGVEVEFVTGSGTTRALPTLKASQVRAIGDDEILSVRSVVAA